MRQPDHPFYTLLRQLRQEAGLSQKQLADRLEKPQSFVSKYESGERRLDILELRGICQQLHTNLPHFAQRLEDLLADYDASKP